MQAEQAAYVTEGHFIVDANTGEIVGTVRDDVHLGPWRPSTWDDVTWVLELRRAEELALVDLKDRIRRLQAQADRRQRAIGWWESRFAGQLEEFTRDQLDGETKRSFEIGDGFRLGLRRTQGSIGVRDQAAAVQWATEHAPEAVRTPDPVVMVGSLKGREAELPDDVFDVTPPRDKFYADVKVGAA